MNGRLLLALGTLVVAAAAGAAAVAGARQDGFPHEMHARLFPLCTGCHEGVPAGDGARTYPSPQVCAGCHNGGDVRRVSWSAPAPRPGNLRFSHQDHPGVAEGDPNCSDCHTRAGASRMAVVRALPERCFACHEHAATSHLVDAPCAQCHLPLAQTAFTAAHVAQLPTPASHQQPRFLEQLHGQLARSRPQQCVVCHTRERCAACHVDATSRPEILALPAAPPQLTLPPMAARYFLPASHSASDWIEQHGTAARTVANCASCHTRESCTTCHAGNAPAPVRALRSRADAAAPGVATVRHAPESHRAPYFAERHGSQAAAKNATCMSCHARTQCEQCHNAAVSGRQRAQVVRTRSFHPENFTQRHASAAYGRNLECANCHETTRFCRACHERAGMNTAGRLEKGFHDAQPFWLLNHGRPARQALESCATCHKQTDCLQCHSQLGAFRISPHGPGFDAKRVQSRNARICFVCHLSDPLVRSSQ